MKMHRKLEENHQYQVLPPLKIETHEEQVEESWRETLITILQTKKTEMLALPVYITQHSQWVLLILDFKDEQCHFVNPAKKYVPKQAITSFMTELCYLIQK